jgi:hypothetical protein
MTHKQPRQARPAKDRNLKGQLMTTSRKLLLAAAFIASAQMAAALTAEQLAASLQSQGYSYIAIETGTTQLAVRAYKDGQAVRAVYDATSGALLATRAETRDAPSGTDTGARLRTGDHDFVTVAADGTVTPLREDRPGDGQRPRREDREERSDDSTHDDSTHDDSASDDSHHSDDGHQGRGRGSDDSDSSGSDDSDDRPDDHGHDHGEGGRPPRG